MAINKRVAYIVIQISTYNITFVLQLSLLSSILIHSFRLCL